jgi:hypothetical protein
MSDPLTSSWTIGEVRQEIASLMALLARHGLSVPTNSSLAIAATDIEEAFTRSEGRTPEDHSVDRRPVWRRIVGLADYARKLSAVEDHKDFCQLRPLLNLLLGQNEISLFTNTDRTNSNNNKLFELFIASSAMRFMTDCQLEDSESGSSRRRPPNPDFIGSWRGKRWGLACKALHSKHPEATLERISNGINQIERSGVDAGLVIINAKNLMPEVETWPGRQVNGEWEYGAYAGIEMFRRQVDEQQEDHLLEVFARASGEDFERDREGRFAAASRGRHIVLKKFTGTKVCPWMPTVWLSVVALAGGGPGVVSPSPFRLITTFSLQDGPMDEETSDFQTLLSLAAQNIAPTKENLVSRKLGK